MNTYDTKVNFAERDAFLATAWRCMLAVVFSIVYPTVASAAGQIAPNPNLSSYPSLIATDGDFNIVPFTNSGTIIVDSVSTFHSVSISNKLGGKFANSNGVLLIQSGINQGATLINTDPSTELNNYIAGKIYLNGFSSQLINQSGASLQNGLPVTIVNNQLVIPHDPATLLSNQNGATLTNTGVGTQLINQSSATLLNTGLSNLINRNGALLVNAFSGTQLVNQGGSILTNTDLGSVLVNDSGGTLTNTGPNTQLRNQNGAQLYNQNGATLTNNASIINDSQIINSVGSKFVVTSVGSVTGVGTYTQYSSGSITNVVAGGSMTQSSVTINGGTLGGGGTINSSTIPTLGTGVLVNNGATVNPGLTPTDPNTLSINGTFTLDNATLKINIGGTGAGQYDRLVINGTAFLTGIDSITFDFIGGFTPNTGDMFEFLSASNFDLTGLLAPFNISYTGLAPGFQYTNVFDSVTNSFSLRADSAAHSSVPEPSTGLLVVTGVVGLLGYGWWRRRNNSEDMEATALIYEFEVPGHGAPARLNKPSERNGQQHLKAAKILQALGG